MSAWDWGGIACAVVLALAAAALLTLHYEAHE